MIVNNNAGNGDYGLAKLLKSGAVRKIICSFPRQSDSWVFDELYHAGKIELELVPQGNLACRIQAAGMGLGCSLYPNRLWYFIGRWQRNTSYRWQRLRT